VDTKKKTWEGSEGRTHTYREVLSYYTKNAKGEYGQSEYTEGPPGTTAPVPPAPAGAEFLFHVHPLTSYVLKDSALETGIYEPTVVTPNDKNTANTRNMDNVIVDSQLIRVVHPGGKLEVVGRTGDILGIGWQSQECWCVAGRPSSTEEAYLSP